MAQIQQEVKRFLTDRKEIARAINIEQKPVIRIEIGKEMRDYENCYEGDKVVVIANDGTDIRCTAEMFGDEEANKEWHGTPWFYGKISLMPEPVFLTNSFGLHDVIEMVEWRKAIRVQEGEEVIVFFHDSEGNHGYIKKMIVGKVSKWVYPTATITNIDVE